MCLNETVFLNSWVIHYIYVSPHKEVQTVYVKRCAHVEWEKTEWGDRKG